MKTIVLAYSGGLDTSIIVPWLREHYDARVICVAADIGQGDELEGVKEKAIASGAAECHIADMREEFVRDYVFPTLRAGAIYNRKYLLGTSMARPIIAKKQVEVAREVGADALSHGCTGKGNDQVRFELTYMAFAPELPVIAPWRMWDIRSREDAIAYAAKHNVPVAASRLRSARIAVSDEPCRQRVANIGFQDVGISSFKGCVSCRYRIEIRSGFEIEQRPHGGIIRRCDQRNAVRRCAAEAIKLGVPCLNIRSDVIRYEQVFRPCRQKHRSAAGQIDLAGACRAAYLRERDGIA
jgi:hypothetical protein